ncbi:MAG: antiterminator LoaP [Lachnospiraceae bacterium]|nr:antiterminator LoaP [Lachnospiraceae bacterium]
MKWYVIQVMSGQEHIVENMCKSCVISEDEEVFIPMYERRKKIGGNWKDEMYILFPGYVFLCTENVEDLYERLKVVPKLTKILKTGDEFIPLHDTEVEFMMRFGGKNHVVEMSVGYIEGDKVVVTEGPMTDWQGNVKKIDRHKRIAIIEVEMFGRMTDVTVGLEVVNKVE